jgi:hypothetical protein
LITLAQSIIRWQALEDAEINLQVKKRPENSLLGQRYALLKKDGYIKLLVFAIKRLYY